MTPPRLILVRHAEPEMDPDIDAMHWALSVSGRRAATRLADQLEAFAPDVIVTSQLPKAFETGRILAENLIVPVETEPGLHELERRNVGWRSSAEFRTGVRMSMARPGERVFGEETADEAHARFQEAVGAVLDRHPDETVVIVTHGTVLALFVARLQRGDPYVLWRSLGMPALVVLTRPELEVEALVEEAG